MPKDEGEAVGVWFMFNPTEYTITAASSWKQTPAKGKDGPKSEFTGTLPQTLAMDILFVQDWGGPNKEMHDVIAHHMSLVAVRCETARAARNVPARDWRVVVSPRSRLSPAAEMKAT